MWSEAAPRQAHANLLPTLFERLKDDTPHQRSELPSDCLITAFKMRELIRDSLTDLFNTINLDSEIDAVRYPEAAASVLNYGIPPLAGGYLSKVRWFDIERMVRKAVLTFEPRIIPETLRIFPPLDERENHAANTLRFTIQAMIHMDPHPLEFALQSDLDLETSCFEGTLIKGGTMQGQKTAP